MFKLDLEKEEEPEIKLSTSIGSSKKQESSRKNIYFCFIDYAKAFDLWITTNWKILKEIGIPDHLTSLLRNLYAGQDQRLELDKEQINFKSGKKYIKAVYCHQACLAYMQNTSCEMPGWMKNKLESSLLGEISITSDTQMTPPLRQKVKN